MNRHRRRGRARNSSLALRSPRRYNRQDASDSYRSRRSEGYDVGFRSLQSRCRNNRRISKTPGSRGTDFEQYTRPSNRVVRSVYEGMRASVVRLEDALVTLNANLERLAPDPSDMPYSPTMGTVVYVPVPQPTPAVTPRSYPALREPTVRPSSKTENPGPSMGPVVVAPKPLYSHTKLIHPEGYGMDNSKTSAAMTQAADQTAFPARSNYFIEQGSDFGESLRRQTNVLPSTNDKMSIVSLCPTAQNQNQSQSQNFQSASQTSHGHLQWPASTKTKLLPNQPLSSLPAPAPASASDQWAACNSHQHFDRDATSANIIHQPPQRRSLTQGERQAIQTKNIMLGQKMRDSELSM